MAGLAQNGDGLRADQAGAPDDDDLHGFPRLSTTQMGSNAWRNPGAKSSVASRTNISHRWLSAGHLVAEVAARQIDDNQSSRFVSRLSSQPARRCWRAQGRWRRSISRVAMSRWRM